jgi:hypothetical protein
MQAMREGIERCEWQILHGTEDERGMDEKDTVRG